MIRTLLLGTVFSIMVILAGCGPSVQAQHSLAQDNYVLAEQQYEDILANHPHDWRMLVRLGYARLQQKHFAQAVTPLEQARLELAGRHRVHYALFYLGVAHLGQGNADKALEMWGAYRAPGFEFAMEIQEMRAQLAAGSFGSGPEAALRAMDRMERAQARQWAADRAENKSRWTRTGDDFFGNSDGELAPWDKQRRDYLP